MTYNFYLIKFYWTFRINNKVRMLVVLTFYSTLYWMAQANVIKEKEVTGINMKRKI